MWIVYIVECTDGTYYTGLTEDLDERIKKHNSHKGARYTKLKRPVTLSYFEKFSSKMEAIKREIQIKKLSHIHKKYLTKSGMGVSLVTDGI